MPSSRKGGDCLGWLGCGRRDGGWNPRMFAIAMVGAGVTFLIMMNITRFANIPDLPYYPLTHVIFGDEKGRWYGNWHASLLLIAWSEHYVRRVIEILFIHQYSRSESTLSIVGAIIYYVIFGTWVGWSVNVDWYTWLRKGPPPYMVAIGILFFLAGEAINAYCHWLLMRVRKPNVLRRKNKRSYVVTREELPEAVALRKIPSRIEEDNSTGNNGTILADDPPEETPSQPIRMRPSSVLFRFCPYPHYIAEFVAWTGYAFMAFTWATWAFAVVSGLVMLVRALLRTFGGNNTVDSRT